MGDMADDMYILALIAEGELEAKAQEVIDDYKEYRLYWKPLNGDPILVHHMGNVHVKNCLAQLKRKKKQYEIMESWIYVFEHELRRRHALNIIII